MKFQPGQSGNPAGRPLGARNKKTIAMEEKLAEQAEKAVDWIVHLAQRGDAVAMRICAEWVKPGGTSLRGERLYSPVNSDAESLPPRAQASEGEGGERSEPGGGFLQAADSDLANSPESGGLYFPVNLEDAPAAELPPPGAADAAPPSPASGAGIGACLYFPVNYDAEAVASAEEETPLNAMGKDDSLYFPVNSQDGGEPRGLDINPG
jgi:hypothetical protein